MIKVENKSKEEIAEIGRKIGEAFAAEKDGIVTMVTREQAVKAFEIITDYYYRAGVLYATSEKSEGYLAYWRKKEYAKVFRKEPDYIVVSMVVVLREFQGKGVMHKVLEQPFAEAASKDIPCVLDTDTPLKVKKYIRCGMELCGKKKLRHGIFLYTMAYRRAKGGVHYDG